MKVSNILTRGRPPKDAVGNLTHRSGTHADLKELNRIQTVVGRESRIIELNQTNALRALTGQAARHPQNVERERA